MVAPYRYTLPPLLPGRLVRRYKRFLADVELDSGEAITAHCTNTGSMAGCAQPKSRVLVSRAANPARKLPFTWEAIEVGAVWVSINTLTPNRALRGAIEAGAIPELAGYESVRPEVRYGHNSRIDLLLEAPDRPPCYVEIKNVTLIDEAQTARFPDAVTTRGQKHLRELMALCQVVDQTPARAVLAFFIPRADARACAAADHIDPLYGSLLREALAAGVEVLPYRFRVDQQGLELIDRLPLQL